MGREGLPGGARNEGRDGGGARCSAHGQLAFWRAALFEAITARRSFHDFTKGFAPSSCNWAAGAPTATPAFGHSPRTAPQAPPPTGRGTPLPPGVPGAL